jgi:hypothetical protein
VHMVNLHRGSRGGGVPIPIPQLKLWLIPVSKSTNPIVSVAVQLPFLFSIVSFAHESQYNQYGCDVFCMGWYLLLKFGWKECELMYTLRLPNFKHHNIQLDFQFLKNCEIQTICRGVAWFLRWRQFNQALHSSF